MNEWRDRNKPKTNKQTDCGKRDFPLTKTGENITLLALKPWVV